MLVQHLLLLFSNHVHIQSTVVTRRSFYYTVDHPFRKSNCLFVNSESSSWPLYIDRKPRHNNSLQPFHGGFLQTDRSKRRRVARWPVMGSRNNLCLFHFSTSVHMLGRALTAVIEIPSEPDALFIFNDFVSVMSSLFIIGVTCLWPVWPYSRPWSYAVVREAHFRSST